MTHFLTSQIAAHGYLAVFVLMVLESACIPVPSEAVMTFGGALAAGLLASGGHAHVSLLGIGAAGAVGNLVGAVLAYAVGRYGGQPFVDRWGRYVLLRRHDLDRAHRFFARHGTPAVFVGRLLPVVRTFISLPAGAARMPVGRFAALTFLGSVPWSFALAYAGYALADHWDAVASDFTPASVAFAVAAVVAIGWWAWRARARRRADAETATGAATIGASSTEVSTGPSPTEASSTETASRGRRWRRLRYLIPGAVLVVLSPAIYSYTTTMVQPSSLPLGVRSVEWVRSHHGSWLVDTAEHVWYGWLKAPSKGGAPLTALPSAGMPSGEAAASGGAGAPGTASSPSPRATTVPAVTTSRAATSPAATPWPPPVQPVITPALPGEGVWRATGPAVAGGPPVLVTEFRPEPDYPRIVAYVAWFDHTRTDLAFYPGRYEPPKAAVRGPMEVPQGQRSRLLATFNAGFIYSDGHNGSSDNGRTNEPLKDGLATLVGYRDGRVDIVIWHGGPNPGPQYAFTRQSLPPILWHDTLNPALNDTSQWGATLGNAVRVWRTGVGIDRHGNLIYAAADGQTVESLARLLQHAGAVKAMQFDINPEWPSLITYQHHHGLVPDKIVPNWQQSADRYLVPDDRDFFAVYTPVPGPVTVPFS